MECPPAEWLRPSDGSCIPAGVPADGCGEGFVSDGDRGCSAILPALPCPSGLTAIPGETACREIASCGSGTWGDIRIEPSTVYVDANYSGGASDGSAQHPFITIEAGIGAATAGAIVAIAQGSYLEDVVIASKPLRLWGVCPAQVEIVGTGNALAALQVTFAPGTEVRGIAIRGNALGVVVSGALDVAFERVWVHDNAARGLNVENELGPTSIVIRDALIEHNREVGLFVEGADAILERSTIRTTDAGPSGAAYGLGARADAMATPATIAVARSLIEDNIGYGLFAAGSVATIEATAIRNTQADTNGLYGRGVTVQDHSSTGAPSTLTLRTSVVEHNHDLGVFVSGSSATIEASVVRNTEVNPGGFTGRGISLQAHATTGAPTMLALSMSLVDQNKDTGIVLEGSDATVYASAVRNTLENSEGEFGRGISMQPAPATGGPSRLVLGTSLVEGNQSLGIRVAGSSATVEGSVIRATTTNSTRLGGRGLHVHLHQPTGHPATLLVRRSVIEENNGAGLSIVSADATIEQTVVRNTFAEGTGFGEGVLLLSEFGPTNATITNTRVDRSPRAGLAIFGGHAALRNVALTCQAFDLDREEYLGIPAELDDQGGNRCGCPEPALPCKAVSANLEAPPPLE